ncbi:MAG: 2-dehydropantoate 2-reductase [Chloroflexota bacterium]|nr:MAG: 2-dehydropantoate 2-reductase [Chloroflexota bacterium]
MDSKPEPLLIVGTGAMASLFAAMLSASGVQVRMLGTWKEGIQALNTYGVRLIDELGKEFTYPVEATDDPKLCTGSQFAIVLVKSYQTNLAAQKLTTCLNADGVALTLQNGLNNHQALSDVLGESRVASGVTTAGATLIDPGIVRIGGRGITSLKRDIRLDLLVSQLSRAGFEVEEVKDTDALIWGKLVINAAINPLTALLRVPNGQLISNPSARRVMNLVTIEAAEVAGALGVNLPYPDPVPAVEAVAQRTASNQSSMYKDVLRGSQTEIDAINGAIVRAGESAGVPVEYNRMLWLVVSALAPLDEK